MVENEARGVSGGVWVALAVAIIAASLAVMAALLAAVPAGAQQEPKQKQAKQEQARDGASESRVVTKAGGPLRGLPVELDDRNGNGWTDYLYVHGSSNCSLVDYKARIRVIDGDGTQGTIIDGRNAWIYARNDTLSYVYAVGNDYEGDLVFYNWRGGGDGNLNNPIRVLRTRYIYC